MSASAPQLRLLIGALAEKIAASEAELDAQAMSNALYGLQVLLPIILNSYLPITVDH